jgi:uncharacterized membrane protein HdeD (DUF308 family)
MSRGQRIRSFFLGLGMLLGALCFLLLPDIGYHVAAYIIIFSLLSTGVRMLFFYHTMARHMVGGKAMLFLGILILDFGVFALSMVNNPMIFIVVYLLFFHSFSGLVHILRSREAKTFSAGSWITNLLAGIVNLAASVAAIVFAVFLHSIEALAFLYCAGMLYSAVVRISSAFRNTSIVYIP